MLLYATSEARASWSPVQLASWGKVRYLFMHAWTRPQLVLFQGVCTMHGWLIISGGACFLHFRLFVVLVEKILRVQPDVKKLFLLIRATDAESVKQRVKTEVKTKYFSILPSTSYFLKLYPMAQSELFPSHANIFLETISPYKDRWIIFFPEGSARALPKYISRRKKNYTEKLLTRRKKKTNNRPLSWKKLAPTTEENRVWIF